MSVLWENWLWIFRIDPYPFLAEPYAKIISSNWQQINALSLYCIISCCISIGDCMKSTFSDRECAFITCWWNSLVNGRKRDSVAEKSKVCNPWVDVLNHISLWNKYQTLYNHIAFKRKKNSYFFISFFAFFLLLSSLV